MGMRLANQDCCQKQILHELDMPILVDFRVAEAPAAVTSLIYEADDVGKPLNMSGPYRHNRSLWALNGGAAFPGSMPTVSTGVLHEAV